MCIHNAGAAGKKREHGSRGLRRAPWSRGRTSDTMESAGDGTLAMRRAYPLQGYRSGRDTEYHGNEFAVGIFLWGPAREAGPKEI